MKLNDATVRSLPAPTATSVKLYVDDTLPHFAVRVARNGSNSFILTLGRERKRITLGRYPLVTLAQARNKARKLLAERELTNAERVRLFDPERRWRRFSPEAAGSRRNG